MTKSNLAEKMVLGTAQFGMNYGIANLSGKPTEKEAFRILEHAWDRGVRRFDTAPTYGSEAILGEFIRSNALQREAIVLTKIPKLAEAKVFQEALKSSINTSLEQLGCTIDVLFLHEPLDVGLLLDNADVFRDIPVRYPVKCLGISVYEPTEVARAASYEAELAFQFPLNVLDRRFESVKMPYGKRYARSIFLQGLLASPNHLRKNAPSALSRLGENYHQTLKAHGLDPIALAISFVAQSAYADYFLVGVDTVKQLQEILDTPLGLNLPLEELDRLRLTTEERWLDPRVWN